MRRELDALDDHLSAMGVDGYLVDAPGTNADQRYVTGFGAVDPFTSLYVNGTVHLLVRGLDRGLAREDSFADTVAAPVDFSYREKVEEHGAPEAQRLVAVEFVRSRDVNRVAVPERFPLGRAEGLRAADIGVEVTTEDILGDIRAVKTDEEVAAIREAQRATERSMRRVQSLLSDATVADGVLQAEGETLTSERLKEEIEVTLVRNGCALEETIVAGGEQAADPHHRGNGPLSPNEPIVVDIFPREKETKYHADMTRTFCVGEPSETARAWYDRTEAALETALDMLSPGVTGAAVHDAVCDVYEEAGIPTTRSDEGTDRGFVHGTGHGVGLEVHEAPSVNTVGEELEVGHVVTIEPGVYDPSVGGIRIEDLVVITEDGHENLTDYEKQFVV